MGFIGIKLFQETVGLGLVCNVYAKSNYPSFTMFINSSTQQSWSIKKKKNTAIMENSNLCKVVKKKICSAKNRPKFVNCHKKDKFIKVNYFELSIKSAFNTVMIPIY